MKFSKELKAGIVAVLILGLFYWGFNFLKGMNVMSGALNSYYTEYDNIQGLTVASPVSINGYNIGKVIEIQFNEEPSKRGKLVVQFTVDGNVNFSKNSKVKIFSQSLMGGKALAIVPSYEGEQAEPGDYLAGEIESDMLSSFGEKLNPLQSKLENTIVNIDSLSHHLNQVLDASTRESIKGSFKNLNSVLHNLKDASWKLNQVVGRNSQTIDQSLENTQALTQNLKVFSDSLNQMELAVVTQKLNGTLTNIQALTTQINQGQGTLGKLAKDETLYDNLEGASKELEELLRDMKLHPKRFVHFSLFGKKDKGYKPQEDKK